MMRLTVESKTTKEAKNPLLDMLGANTESRSFASAAEVDKYIEDLRNWKTHESKVEPVKKPSTHQAPSHKDS